MELEVLMPGPQPYTYAEGGGALPAYGEDFFQRIVGVHWPKKVIEATSAIFVIGTFNGSVYYTMFDGSVITPGELPLRNVVLPIPVMNGYPILRGSSVAFVNEKPVFLVCGVASDNMGPPPATLQFSAFVCASNDGINWRQVFNGPQGFTVDHVGFKQPWVSDSFALVWDPVSKAFYYSMYMDKSTADQEYQHEIILSSSDGNDWSQVDDRDIRSDGPSTFPSTYCSHNNCFDGRNQHVPDGVMFFDEKAKFLMRPDDPPAIDYSSFGGGRWWSEPPINTIDVINQALNKEFHIGIPGILEVPCVAGGAGIWIAGGWNASDGTAGAVAFSLDQGRSWTVGPTIDSGVVTISAALATGIPAKP